MNARTARAFVRSVPNFGVSLASREGKTERSIRMTLSLAFLAPEIVKAAVEGHLPRGLVSSVSLIFPWPGRISGARSDSRRRRSHKERSVLPRLSSRDGLIHPETGYASRFEPQGPFEIGRGGL